MLSSRAPGKIEFVEVRKPRRKPPTWVGASQRARSGLTTLKPPRLPSELSEEVSGFVHTEQDGFEATPRDGESLEYPRGYNPDPGSGGWSSEQHDPRGEDGRREITPPPPRGPLGGVDEGLEMRAAMEAVMASVPPPIRTALEPQLDPRELQDTALTELRTALETSLGLRDDWLRESEEQLVELVSVIARRVIAREVRSDPGLVRSLVREGLDALGGADRVVVRLGPAFSGAVEQLSEELGSNTENCQVLVDPDLAQHGCVIETAYGRVDESLEARLDQVLRALTPEAE